MGKRIAFVGAGAVGSYVGGMLAAAGEDVTLIEPWPDHVNVIKNHGLRITDSHGEKAVTVKALHVHEAQQLIHSPVDIAFITTKSYDTEWATALIKEYLAPSGYLVSLQNSLNEESIASLVGWGRVTGCIASTLGVVIAGPGHVARTYEPGGDKYTVFRVGEVHGRITTRIGRAVALLDKVDSARPTTNLWGERWSKLVMNSMANPVSAVTGLSDREMALDPKVRKIMIKLASEAVTVGQALGYALEPIHGIEAQRWVEDSSVNQLEKALLHAAERATDKGRPSTIEDILVGRRTEIDFFNGLIVRRGQELSISTPANEAAVKAVHSLERGEMPPDPSNLEKVWPSHLLE